MKALRPLKAIQDKCLDCSGGSLSEVRLCEAEDCPLWPYRMDHNPARAGKGGRSMIREQETSQKTSTYPQFFEDKRA
jgi:hypothetical protein